MRYRVDQLAARAGVSVDTVRFYQAKGLLPAPEREGRAAWYTEGHRERLERIRDLKAKGFTLASIGRLLAGDLDPPDAALAGALAEALPGADSIAEEFITIEELARRTGVSTALLEAVQRDGLLVPRTRDGEPAYTTGDVGAVAAGMALLETGLPLSELLALARDHHHAMQQVAARAVELFVRFVRDPIRAGAADDADAAQKMVDAFHKMLPATRDLVTHHFERVLLAEALARIEREGDETEVQAVRDQAARGLEGSWRV